MTHTVVLSVWTLTITTKVKSRKQEKVSANKGGAEFAEAMNKVACKSS